jgi:PHS family inorganic phosphate transporter-like MFS transporter
VVSKTFEAAASKKLSHDHTPEDADIAWRLILMLGAVPAGLTYYWRMMMPETARYTIYIYIYILKRTSLFLPKMSDILKFSLSLRE